MEKPRFCPPERSQNKPRGLQDCLWNALGQPLVALGPLLAALGLLLASLGSLLARLEPLLAALGPLLAPLGSLLVALGPLQDRPALTVVIQTHASVSLGAGFCSMYFSKQGISSALSIDPVLVALIP